MDANITICFYGVTFLASTAIKTKYPNKLKPLNCSNARKNDVRIKRCFCSIEKKVYNYLKYFITSLAHFKILFLCILKCFCTCHL